MKLYFLGICGTFMASLALLAKALGYEVFGCDAKVYPPMSDVLKNAGIKLQEGFLAQHISDDIDLVIVGNVVKRGNAAMEAVLNRRLAYQSGPQWLYEKILQQKTVLAVAGTHGKTTTASMLAWILQFNGYKPGYLIGGVPQNFNASAALGDSDYFVIEADEYDTAFFDKRSKFIHYHPTILLLNNLEFDHADIFADLGAIQTQFALLLRTIPSEGAIIYPAGDKSIAEIFAQGCWTPKKSYGIDMGDWQVKHISQDQSVFEVIVANELQATISWELCGEHNIKNALNAIVAAKLIGISEKQSAAALKQFKNTKRRLEVIYQKNGITLYDDFAHHPTAIKTTLAGLRAKVGEARIIAVIEFASNTMKSGELKAQLAHVFNDADIVLLCQSKEMQWQAQDLTATINAQASVLTDVDAIVDKIVAIQCKGDQIVLMSNKSFEGLSEKLIAEL